MKNHKVKFNNRFIVTHPRFESYIINGFVIGLDELKLKFFITRERDVIDFFKREKLEKIEISWLDEKGDTIDRIVFNGCRVKEVECLGDWNFDNPLEVVITYEINGMGKQE